MAFQTREGGWQDRESEYPNRRTLTPVPGQINTYTIALNEGAIKTSGTEFNSANMTDLETRIVDGFNSCLQISDGERPDITRPITGTDNILNYLYGAGGVVPVSMGGTQARTPEEALSNLGMTQTSFTNLAPGISIINIGDKPTPPETPTFLDNTPQIIAYRLGQTMHLSCYVRFTTTGIVGTGQMALMGFPSNNGNINFNAVELLAGGLPVHEFSTQLQSEEVAHLDTRTNFITNGSLRGIAFTCKATNEPIQLYPETTYNIRFSGSYLITTT